ncbi:MAG: hypothetical protein EXS13_02545 [Planctomycetes bacterium]|nr:hypothetical protein [Planctomycetota bacterium]
MKSVAVSIACAFFAPSADAFDIIELRDGSRLAGELRSTKHGMILTSPLGRLHIETEQVARVVRRNELLARFEAAKAAAGNQAHALASLVGFALERGLYPEAFDACDGAAAAGGGAGGGPGGGAGISVSVLAELRARLIAEALLDGVCATLPPNDDEVRRKLLARITGSSVSRSACAEQLLLAGPRQETESFLLDRLANGPCGERRGAAHLLSRRPEERVLGKLVRASLLDSDANVRETARAGALASHHPQLVVAYLKALETDSAALRERAYPALAEIRDPRAVDGLIAMLEPRRAAGGSGGASLPRAHIFFGEQRAFVQDFDVEIAQGAVIAKPVIGVLQSGVALDIAVAGVFVIRAEERRVVLGALRRLTGVELGGGELGNAALAWRSWWSAQGGALPPLVAAAH